MAVGAGVAGSGVGTGAMALLSIRLVALLTELLSGHNATVATSATAATSPPAPIMRKGERPLLGGASSYSA
ncbi:hypothetical protein LWC33_26060 [Pseudonocardia sp. RS11V-5]|uniref:hypothetical protein n=1 Tax=Pseudonocardia terrae TaxID=2905831 RepID=UPI001E62A1CB|nr:hypothetical protein [Pseudonocardia terrae]MCE3554907.1 hypothetical protein [Pseudonocardia terrae]